MKKYLLAGILLSGLFLQTTAQQFQEPGTETNSPDVNAGISHEEIITAVSATESVLTGYTTSGRVHYKAQLRHNRLHGNWASWYADGNMCDSGTLVNGLPDGEWKVWYPGGRLKYVRNYKADHYHRIHHEIIRYHPRTARYSLSHLYHKDRETAASKMKGTYGFPDYGQNIPANKLSQVAAANTSGNNSYLPVFEKALLHGVFINYNQDGSVKEEGVYDNGLRHGLWTEAVTGTTHYHKGFYIKGQKTRQWKTYDSKGNLIAVEEYKHGKLSWRKEFTN